MERTIKVNEEQMLVSAHEFVLDIPLQQVPTFAIEVALLCHNLIESLSIYSQRGYKILLSLQKKADKKPKQPKNQMLAFQTQENRFLFELTHNQAEYLQVFLLKTYRDKKAEVSHIHLNGTLQQTTAAMPFAFTIVLHN